MTVKDHEIITTPEEEEQPGFEAFLNLTAQIGNDVGTLAALSRNRLRKTLLGTVPVFASAVVPASGTVTLDLGSPVVGKEWQVRGLAALDMSNPTGIITPGVPVAVSVTQAAGSATSAVLPAGSSITGFDVEFQGPAAAVSTTLTVTGLSAAAGGSGTLSYAITIPTNGVMMARPFPAPLPPASGATTPQVNVPVIASGPAYSATVYGTTPASGATPGAGFFYTGIPSSVGTQTARWSVPSLPTIATKGPEQITVPAREHLFAVLTGCTPGHTIVARADITEDTPGHARAVQPI